MPSFPANTLGVPPSPPTPVEPDVSRTTVLASALALVLAASSLAAAPLAGLDDAAGAGWVRVAYDAPITQADLDGLHAAGATAVAYAGDGAYLAYAAGDTGDRIAATPGVAAVDAVDPAAKLTVRPAADTAVVTVRVATVALDDTLATLPVAAEVGDVRLALGHDGATDLVLRLPSALLGAVAALPGVAVVSSAPTRWQLEDEASAQIVAGNIGGRRGAPELPDPGYTDWLAGTGIDTSGVRVAIVDTGIDAEHPDLTVAAKVDWADSPVGEPVDALGHGTHVAGIVGGAGVGLGIEQLAVDADGLRPGLGVAPGLELVDINAIGAFAGEWPPPGGFAGIVQDALDHAASIWNASWTTGEGTGVGYIATAADLDALVLDGDTRDQEVTPFTMVFSAGNSGSGPQTLTSPKAAKNAIIVASSDNVVTPPVLGYSGDPEMVSTFSSRGPTKDGRIGPTVTAPGADIRSARSTDAAGGLCFEVVWSSPLYSFCSGTSMASPHVAGAVALVHGWWRGLTGALPSPAFSKAALVNSARDIYRVGDIPNGDEGWGRVDLGELFDPTVARVMHDATEVLTDPGETRTLAIDVASPGEPLKVTLAWSDVPGLPGAEVPLVNDLDLEVVGPDGTVHRGNVFAGGWSAAGGDPDRMEVLENVYLQAPEAGTYTIVVRAAALPGDGAPGIGDTTDQTYALIVTNAAPADVEHVAS